MFDKKQPLWLPKGSIRAILALLGLGSFVLLCFKNNDIENSKLIAVMVGTAYFIDKIKKTE